MTANADSTNELMAGRFALLSRLADDLAHEIKNPLHAMVINLEVMRRRVASGDVDVALGRADVIEHEIERTHRLVDLILRLIRPERYDGAAEASLEEALDEVIPLLELQAKLARVPFTAHHGAGGATVAGRLAVKYALLALTAPQIEALRADGESSAGLRVEVETGAMPVVRTVSSAAGAVDDEALAFATASIASVGGRLERDADGRTISLMIPRVAGA